MSGIEVAGLVLGAIPLLVVALQHHEACEDKVTIFVYWRKYLARTRRTLLLLHVSYKMTLKTVLKPITDDVELEELLDKPESSLWRSRDIRDALRRGLHDAYEPFLSLTMEVNDIIIEVLNHLDLDRDAAVSILRLDPLLATTPATPKRCGQISITLTHLLDHERP